MSHAFVLFLALVIDAVFGEPEAVWERAPHPAVLMGRAVGWADRMLNHGAGKVVTGGLTIAGLVTLAWGIGWGLSLFGWVAEVLVLAVMLAQRSLVDHVGAVAGALTASLEDGRHAVAKIVGRDTGAMEASDVARGAIESGAENFSDGVVAPAFWFLLLGLPGLLAYKTINTADSMIGYRTPKHEEFGKAAAKLDDLVNWVPARIAAGLIYATRYVRGGWRVIERDAPLHRSPNAGWPEAAMAVVLGVALAGPRRYHGTVRDYPFVNPDGAHKIGPAEIDNAVHSLWRAWGALLAAALLLSIAS